MTSRLTLLVAAFTLAATAPALAQAKLPEGVTPAMVESGQKLFTSKGLCFACHGMNAQGAVGPNLADAEWIHVKGGDYAGLVTLITKGITAEQAKLGKGPMPAKGGAQLTDDEVKAVAAYVYSLSHK